MEARAAEDTPARAGRQTAPRDQAFGGLWGTEAAQLGGCPGAEGAPITCGLTPMSKAPEAAAIGWAHAFAHLHAECVCALSGLVA